MAPDSPDSVIVYSSGPGTASQAGTGWTRQDVSVWDLSSTYGDTVEVYVTWLSSMPLPAQICAVVVVDMMVDMRDWKAPAQACGVMAVVVDTGMGMQGGTGGERSGGLDPC
jgi:hypothetical protein